MECTIDNFQESSFDPSSFPAVATKTSSQHKCLFRRNSTHLCIYGLGDYFNAMKSIQPVSYQLISMSRCDLFPQKNISEQQRESLIQEFHCLNLTKFIQEAVSRCSRIV